MLCEYCKKNKATLFFKQVLDGEIRELSLCKDCAEEQGFQVDSPGSIAEMLFGLEMDDDEEIFVPKKKCPSCGLRSREFKAQTRLGCPTCYETFEEELEPVLADIQEGEYHVGNTPEDKKVCQRAEWLKAELNTAIAAQDFEEAAKIRDLLAGMEEKDGRETDNAG